MNCDRELNCDPVQLNWVLNKFFGDLTTLASSSSEYYGTRSMQLTYKIHTGAYVSCRFDYGEKYWQVKCAQVQCECGTSECRYRAQSAQSGIVSQRSGSLPSNEWALTFALYFSAQIVSNLFPPCSSRSPWYISFQIKSNHPIAIFLFSSILSPFFLYSYKFLLLLSLLLFIFVTSSSCLPYRAFCHFSSDILIISFPQVLGLPNKYLLLHKNLRDFINSQFLIICINILRIYLVARLDFPITFYSEQQAYSSLSNIQCIVLYPLWSGFDGLLMKFPWFRVDVICLPIGSRELPTKSPTTKSPARHLVKSPSTFSY